MSAIIRLFPATPAKTAALRALLAEMGVTGARLRVMRNGAARLNLVSVNDREAARDALVLAGALTASGRPFTDPDSRHAWNGATELFFRFAAP